MMLDAVYASAIGNLGIELNNNLVVGIHSLPVDAQPISSHSSLGKEVIAQLAAYFANKSVSFDLPLQLPQVGLLPKVLDYLLTIPTGQTRTYGEVAQTLDTGPRAVGNSCRRNPLPIIIPCHRIVAKNHLGGYSGSTKGHLLDIKTWLLNHEGRH